LGEAKRDALIADTAKTYFQASPQSLQRGLRDAQEFAYSGGLE